jgi:hypothetical protein
MVLSAPPPTLFHARERLLNIIVNNELLELSDFIEICGRIRARAPHIHIFLGNTASIAEQVSQNLWELPALTVGIGSPVGSFMPKRGDLIYNKAIAKLDQAAILRSKAVRTPRTARFDPKVNYDPALWGEFVILKPAPLHMTSDGQNVRMIRTSRLKEISTAEKVAFWLGTKAPLLVQSFVDTGPRPICWRVLTLFGHALYSLRTISPIARPSLSASDEEIESATIVSKHIDWKDVYNFSDMLFLESTPEILKFARQVAGCFPRIPLLGVDILQHHETGELFALEINAGGNTWHFSSKASASGRTAVGREARIKQFGAWDVAARALITASDEFSR